MRVISGYYKGKQLKMPKGPKVRPTSQLVKEALFDIIAGEIEGSSFLELFAGSGSVGIEALSRGASSVLFVDSNRSCIRTIKANLEGLGIVCQYGLGRKAEEAPKARVIAAAALQALKTIARAKERFDIVFLDPPYFAGALKNCLINLRQYDIVKQRSWLIAEHNAREEIFAGDDLKMCLRKTYGDTALSFYRTAFK